MWRIANIEVAPVELDFSSVDEQPYAATAITAGGVRLFNAIELVDVGMSATQVEVCEGCGTTGCSVGGWVAFRRVGHCIVWLPAWEVMEEGAREASEYSPPAFIVTKGAPIFSPECWERLRALHGKLPPAQDVPRISARETAHLVQWDAPGRVLGAYPSVPRVRRDLVLAATDGDAAIEVTAVDQCLREHYEALDPMDVAPEQMAVRPIELWLDLPGTPGWKGLAHVEEQVCLLLNDTTALVRGRADKPLQTSGRRRRAGQ